MAAENSPLNFTKLEENSDFRAEELYFIRMTNANIAGIFWDVFPRENKNRRKKLYRVVEENVTKPEHRHLLEAIVPDDNDSGKRKVRTLDCLSGIFVNQIIRKLPDDIVEHFEETTLRFNHGLFLRVNEDHGKTENVTLSKALEILYRRRNYLEHYGEPIKLDSKGKPKEKLSDTDKYIKKRCEGARNHSDGNLVIALCYFLLPEILHHFAGRVAHYENKLNPTTNFSNAAIIREIIRDGIKIRRENNKSLFETERAKINNKDKAKRKKIISDGIVWRQEHLKHKEHQGKATDYREHEFKLRYYFIGKSNIAAIKNLLDASEVKRPFHFKRDIEAFYLLSAKINFQIQMALDCVPRDAGKQLIGGNKIETEKLSLIRNTIAHNGMFWNVKFDEKILAVKEIFALAFQKLLKHRNIDAANQFYTRVKQLLHDQNFAFVDIAGDKANDIPPKALHIKNWTKQKREKYLGKNIEGMSVDKRKEFRQKIAKFMRDLDAAREIPLANWKKNDTEGAV